MGCQDISICVGGKRTDAGDETSGHLQAYLWRQNWVFLRRCQDIFTDVFVPAKTRHVGAFADLFEVTKPGICDDT